MKGANLLVFLIVLAAGISFMLSKKKESTKIAKNAATEVETQKKNTEDTSKYSQEPPAPTTEAEDGVLDTPTVTIIERASDPLELAERRVLRNDPAIGEFACDPLDQRPFCMLFNIPKTDDQGIVIGKDLARIAVKAKADAQFQEASQILEGEAVGREEIWTIAYYLFIRDYLVRENLSSALGSVIIIRLYTSSDDTAIVVPSGGMEAYLKFFEREYPNYLSSKDSGFMVEARKFFHLQLEKPSDPMENVSSGE